MVSRFLAILLLALCTALSAPAAENFRMANGDTMVGELLMASANDAGVQIKVGDGKYERVSWAQFSQDDLKKFSQNPKLQAFVEPFIEIPVEDLIKKTEVVIKQPPRLEKPARQSLFGAMFSSGLGFFIVFLLWAGNVYAGYEIAIFRAQSPLLVCGVSAVVPLIAPIVFLSLPTRVKPAEEAPEQAAPAGTVAAAEQAAAAAAAGQDLNPMHADGSVHPAGLHLHTEPEADKAKVSEAVVFQRGQYTFNRRFIETKFANFFGVVRHNEDRDKVLVVKAARGTYTADRISRIASNDMHIQVRKGHASEEVMIPFQEIQEIRLQHRDAK
jgi:hypothetical protein